MSRSASLCLLLAQLLVLKSYINFSIFSMTSVFLYTLAHSHTHTHTQPPCETSLSGVAQSAWVEIAVTRATRPPEPICVRPLSSVFALWNMESSVLVCICLYVYSHIFTDKNICIYLIKNNVINVCNKVFEDHLQFMNVQSTQMSPAS